MNFLFHHLNKLVFYHSFNMALLLPHEMPLPDTSTVLLHRYRLPEFSSDQTANRFLISMIHTGFRISHKGIQITLIIQHKFQNFFIML